jgi:small subunit ribosomal protein S2
MIKKDKKWYNKFLYEKFISYGLHLGCLNFFWNSKLKAYFLGSRKNFLIFDLGKILYSFRSAFMFLAKIHLSGKKILFVGFPKGNEKEFSNLCKQHGHYVLDNWPHGFFQKIKKSRFTDPKLKPAVLFVFSPLSNSLAILEANRYDIPVLAFINANESIEGVDFPIFANLNSIKGGLFSFNLFKQLFLLKTPKNLPLISRYRAKKNT